MFLGNGRETDNGTTSVARQQIVNGKNRWPLLENGSAHTFPKKRLAYENKMCCPRGPRRGVIIWETKSVLYGRLWREDLSAEAEESILLEAVTRERLVKTQQAGKSLSWCRGDLWIVKIRVAMKLLAVPRRVYKWQINLFANPNPVYSYTHTCDNMKLRQCTPNLQ
jgi:hypothetical protein